MRFVYAPYNSIFFPHGTNSFWKLLFAVFNKPFSKEYSDRLNFILEHKIAVWDVIGSCVREGSSDKNIIDPKPNDIPALLKSYPGIKSIIITSEEVRRCLFQFFPELKSFHHIQVISSSSGTVGVSFKEKMTEWKQLLELAK